MTDVIVVGGGVIGLSIAWELAGQGLAVKVLEQGEFGQEASWAGAGILPPGNPAQAKTPEARLRAASHVLWPEWSATLREQTGIDNGWRNCGAIELRLEGSPDQLHDDIDQWRREGVTVDELTPDLLLQREPAVNPEVVSACRLPEASQVRNPRHLKALVAGCAARGVELAAGQPVVAFEREGGKVVAVETPGGTHPAGKFCIAGGAWSERLLGDLGGQIPIVPVRGQIVLLAVQPPLFRHVLHVGRRYLVPRPDGRVLVGSTEERVGFDKRNTAAAVGDLLAFAVQVVPALAAAKYERAWAGLRPGSADGLPYLDRVPEFENLFIAAGHFRAGLQLSPGTAVLMRQLMLCEERPGWSSAFALDRLGVR